MNEYEARQGIVDAGRLLHSLGLCPGTSGNISVRLAGGVVVSPTNSRLGRLEPADLALVSTDGVHIGGEPPSKEATLHRAVYRARPGAQAIVHLHATDSVAVSCLSGLDEHDALPPLTAYFLMRVGTVPCLPFAPPGAAELAVAAGAAAESHRGMLLANHGSVFAGDSLADAVTGIEELEEAARLFLRLRDYPVRPVPPDQVERLRRPARDAT
jgi:3-dehydro-4-phosphotetronate decarboxylase